jgi:hypothetical protein
MKGDHSCISIADARRLVEQLMIRSHASQPRRSKPILLGSVIEELLAEPIASSSKAVVYPLPSLVTGGVCTRRRCSQVIKSALG